MRAFASALILGVFVAHHSNNWLAEGTSFSPAAVFYMLQGAWTAVLSACVLLFVVHYEPASRWRSLAILALAVSIIEGLMIPICRFGVVDIASVPRGVTMCDHVTGLPVAGVILTMEAAALLWIVGSYFFRKDRDDA